MTICGRGGGVTDWIVLAPPWRWTAADKPSESVRMAFFLLFCREVIKRDGLRRAIQAVVPVSCARQRSREKEEEGGGGDTREEVLSDLFLICFSDDLLQTSPLAHHQPPLPSPSTTCLFAG